jgi:hypothetical protein
MTSAMMPEGESHRQIGALSLESFRKPSRLRCASVPCETSGRATASAQTLLAKPGRRRVRSHVSPVLPIRAAEGSAHPEPHSSLTTRSRSRAAPRPTGAPVRGPLSRHRPKVSQRYSGGFSAAMDGAPGQSGTRENPRSSPSRLGQTISSSEAMRSLSAGPEWAVGTSLVSAPNSPGKAYGTPCRVNSAGVHGS